MTDEKIKPVGRVARTFIGEQKARWYEKLPNGTYLYPESALLQAKEEGRLAGMREAQFIADKLADETLNDDELVGANKCVEAINKAITRASEGK
jgi:hypothetical protein